MSFRQSFRDDGVGHHFEHHFDFCYAMRPPSNVMITARREVIIHRFAALLHVASVKHEQDLKAVADYARYCIPRPLDIQLDSRLIT
jgi:hypothetical protein